MPQRKGDRRYWDSCTILHWLQRDPDAPLDELATQIARGLHLAQDGQLMIVVSAFTLTEVLHLRGEKSLPEDRRADVLRFFDRSSIVVRELDRRTGELARDLVWSHGIDPKDSVHVATALRAESVALMETKDEPLRKKGPIDVDGYPALRIVRPEYPESYEQGSLDLVSKVEVDRKLAEEKGHED